MATAGGPPCLTLFTTPVLGDGSDVLLCTENLDGPAGREVTRECLGQRLREGLEVAWSVEGHGGRRSGAMANPSSCPLACVVVTIGVSAVDDARAFAAWYAQHEHVLHYASSNQGCSCCEDCFDLEGPLDVLTSLPEAWRRLPISSLSEQRRSRIRHVPPRLLLSALKKQRARRF